MPKQTTRQGPVRARTRPNTLTFDRIASREQKWQEIIGKKDSAPRAGELLRTSLTSTNWLGLCFHLSIFINLSMV